MASVAVALFVAGCIFGSFLSVVAHRLPRKESFVTGRSRCPSCGAQIAARDNIPVISWLLLRGRCRHCGEPISARYPLAEIGLGVLWAATYLILGDDDGGQLALGLVLCALLADDHAHRPRSPRDPERDRSLRRRSRDRRRRGDATPTTCRSG